MGKIAKLKGVDGNHQSKKVKVLLLFFFQISKNKTSLESTHTKCMYGTYSGSNTGQKITTQNSVSLYAKDTF